jgi:hypothetical protein
VDEKPLSIRISYLSLYDDDDPSLGATDDSAGGTGELYCSDQIFVIVR